MMDRYRLMCYMLDQGASETDIANLNEEILSLEDKVLTETNTTAPTKVEEDLAYHDLLMSQSLHYSVPMNMEKRTFGKPPVKAAIQDASNVTEHITELGENGTPRLPGVWRRQ
ncbi:hypothetical protein AGDE_14937 [Angomonas deanei]|uniref:Uncharacterized protein n=1 Tax=Angomonas deanei TaxID=59799 RepID=A0A7G2CQ84_9TRYP|nr:hypothetical protein AGDE_14937 [Angomonas deanei]CAD2220703.1 hypothetical protein, conserved [Angomonas deanei]|eukprot:EPY19957.1 hypothetical protein AGDE_14937 [Angomonas deanei]